jgi:hypothetical protein
MPIAIPNLGIYAQKWHAFSILRLFGEWENGWELTKLKSLQFKSTVSRDPFMDIILY